MLIIIISGHVSDVKGYDKTFLIQISFSIEFLIFDKKSLLTKSIRFSFRLLMELKTVTDVVKIFQIFQAFAANEKPASCYLVWSSDVFAWLMKETIPELQSNCHEMGS